MFEVYYSRTETIATQACSGKSALKVAFIMSFMCSDKTHTFMKMSMLGYFFSHMALWTSRGEERCDYKLHVRTQPPKINSWSLFTGTRVGFVRVGSLVFPSLHTSAPWIRISNICLSTTQVSPSLRWRLSSAQTLRPQHDSRNTWRIFLLTVDRGKWWWWWWMKKSSTAEKKSVKALLKALGFLIHI